MNNRKRQKVEVSSLSRSERAGLQFSVAKIHQDLQSQSTVRVAPGAPVYLSGVLQGLTTEVLKIAGETSDQNRIEPKDIQNVFAGNKCLNSLIQQLNSDRDERVSELEELKGLVVAIDGNVCIGKSSLVQEIYSILNDKIPVTSLQENLDSSLTDAFYTHPHDSAFGFVMHMGTSHSHLLRTASHMKEHGFLCALDRSALSSLAIAMQAVTHRIISQRQFDIYLHFHQNEFKTSVPHVVYLDCDPSISYACVADHRRKQPISITLDFLEGVDDILCELALRQLVSQNNVIFLLWNQIHNDGAISILSALSDLRQGRRKSPSLSFIPSLQVQTSCPSEHCTVYSIVPLSLHSAPLRKHSNSLHTSATPPSFFPVVSSNKTYLSSNPSPTKPPFFYTSSHDIVVMYKKLMSSLQASSSIAVDSCVCHSDCSTCGSLKHDVYIHFEVWMQPRNEFKRVLMWHMSQAHSVVFYALPDDEYTGCSLMNWLPSSVS